MSEIQNYNLNKNISQLSPAMKKNSENEVFCVDAHSSKNMKVKRPKVLPNDLMINLPQKNIYSDREATKKIQAINTDIYENAKKEKDRHEFNFKHYFTICGIVALLAGAIAYFRRGR